jgi:DNA-binding protein YbaB
MLKPGDEFCNCGSPVNCGSYDIQYFCEDCRKMEEAFYAYQEELEEQKVEEEESDQLVRKVI